jgi:hypothetical protein
MANQASMASFRGIHKSVDINTPIRQEFLAHGRMQAIEQTDNRVQSVTGDVTSSNYFMHGCAKMVA